MRRWRCLHVVEVVVILRRDGVLARCRDATILRVHKKKNKGLLRVHKKTDFSDFGRKQTNRSNFLIFFPYWRWGRLPHLPKTEVLAVKAVLKMAIFAQIVIFDIGEIDKFQF